jgi:hypothetical protein
MIRWYWLLTAFAGGFFAGQNFAFSMARRWLMSKGGITESSRSESLPSPGPSPTAPPPPGRKPDRTE